MFYIYEHRYKTGDKKGQPFYVGKGKGNRINEKFKRNEWWNNITNKYGYTRHKIAEFDKESDAFEAEKALIKIHRDNGLVLCNLTDGGEGTSGVVVSEETKSKMVASRKRFFATEEGKKIKENRRLAYIKRWSDRHRMKPWFIRKYKVRINCGEYGEFYRIDIAAEVLNLFEENIIDKLNSDNPRFKEWYQFVEYKCTGEAKQAKNYRIKCLTTQAKH